MTGSSKSGVPFWRNFVSPRIAVLLSCGSKLPAHYLGRRFGVLVLLLFLPLLLPLTVPRSSSRAPYLFTVSISTAACPLYAAALYLIVYSVCPFSCAGALCDKHVGAPCTSPDTHERTLSSCSACRVWKRARPKWTAAHNTGGQYCHQRGATIIGFVLWGAPRRRAAGVAEARQNLFRQRIVDRLEGRIVSALDGELPETKLGQQTPLQALLGKDEKIEAYHPASPLLCKVVSIQQINGESSGSTESASAASAAPEIFSIVLDHQGKLCFREGQSVGIIPRLLAASPAGKATTLVTEDGLIAGSEKLPRTGRLWVRPRLYSIASGRQGDDGSGNTFTLCVKKHLYRNPVTGVREPAKDGLCSNYICSVRPGDTVAVSGPVGKALLLPVQGSPPLVMLGTGTGVAPFRSHMAHVCASRGFQNIRSREVFVFLGSRSAASLPYMAEWQALKAKNDEHGIDIHFAWSRPANGERKTYIQDLMWNERGKVWDALANKKGHLYVCGVRDMLVGVESVLNRMAAERQLAEGSLVRQLKVERRWHVEVY